MSRLLPVALLICAAAASSQAPPKTLDPNNNWPTPYRTLREWAELPKGMTWPAITGAQEGPDGRLYVLGRCHENSCTGRAEPAVLIYDMSGKLLDSLGRGAVQFPAWFLDRPRG